MARHGSLLHSLLKRIHWIAVLVASFHHAALAKEIVLDRSSGRPSAIELVSDGLHDKAEPALTFGCHIQKLTADEVDTPRGRFARLSIPGFQHSGTIGAPALPVMNRLIEVPVGARVEVTASGGKVETVSLDGLGVRAPVLPRQPSQPKSGKPEAFAYKKSAYATKGYYQDEIVSVEELGLLRHRRLVLLRVAPVAYSAVDGKLEVRNDFRIRMTLAGADLARTAALKRTYGTPVQASVGRDVVVPASLRALDRETGHGPIVYLIVADRMFEQDLRPYVEWKTSKGFAVVVAYTDTIGNTTDRIKAYVRDLYDRPPVGKAAPTYLLLVGDHEQIPAFRGKAGNHFTDLYYATVTPGDDLPDLLIGRFSARTREELVPQIDKTLEYERYRMADPSYLKSALLVAGWDYNYTREWGWPQIDYAGKSYLNADHGISDTKLVFSGGPHQNEPRVLDRLNAGCCYANYTAHGSETSWVDPTVTIKHVDALRNRGKYPLVVGNCCFTASFQVGTCLAEAWLRAKDTGAIGYIGGSDATYWDEDLWWGVGFYPIVHPNPDGLPPQNEETGRGAYDAMFDGSCSSNGAMLQAGNLAVEQSNSSRRLYYWEIYHLLGDPSLMVYWGVPRKITVRHAVSVPVGTTSLELEAQPGSYAGISMNGELLGAGFANEHGTITITPDHPLGNAGTVQVVVTAQNASPYFGSVEVVP